MTRLTNTLGWTAAGLTVLAAVVTPFLLMPAFATGVGRLGLHVDSVYGGGEPARTLEREGYRVVVNKPVTPQGLARRLGPFVQVAWTPAAALPARVSEEIDLDGDGRSDALVSFAVPRDGAVPLHVDVEPRSTLVGPLHVTGTRAFDALITRVGNRIVVRVPLRSGPGGEASGGRKSS